MDLVTKELSAGEEECFCELCCGLTRFNWSHRSSSTNLEETLIMRREKIRQRLAKARDTELFLLAFLDNRPVGYAIAEIDHQASSPIAFFDELYVMESERGHGIGKRLLNEVTAWSQRHQAAKLRLNAFVWNEGARRFYESQGFHMWAVCYEVGLPIADS